MNLNKKGWLKEYLELKEKEYHDSRSSMDQAKGNHPDESLYALIQPTGIMYGYPVITTGSGTSVLDRRSQTKLLIMDALLGSYRLLMEARRTEEQPTILLEEGVNKIAQFYNTIYPELYTKPTSFFGKRKADSEIVEQILDKRINPRFQKENFWMGFFYNSLLFLDIFFFRQWVQTPDDAHISEYLKNKKDETRVDIVKVMAAAAHANQNIEVEERKLFEYFIHSLELKPELKEEATRYFEEGVMIEDIPLPPDDSWILKKFLFELAILTTWADRKIEESEEDFLIAFNNRLGFSENDFSKSMIAVEGFVLEYWKELDKLSDNSDFEYVSQQYIERLKNLAQLHRDSLYKAIYKRGMLIKLIQKARVGNANEQEKEFIREQIIKSMQELPVFDVIKLPEQFLSLNILMKVLPEDFFSKVN